MIEKEASDLHITAGERPKLRVDGDITDSSVTEVADAQGHAAARLLGPDREPEEAVRDRGRARLLVRHSEPRALPRQLLQAARLRVDGHPQIPFNDQDASRSSGCPPVIAKLAERPRGLILVTGPDRLGQVDHARRDDRQDQQGAEGPHHHGRRPDRVHPPPPELHRQPARGRHRHQELRRPRSSTRCVRTPTSSWSAKCATWRRSQAALTIAETGHLAFATLHTNSRGRGDQPHHRRLPVATSSRRCARSSRSCSRASSPRRCCRRRKGRGRVMAARDPGRHAGHPRAHPRRQDPPDLLDDAVGQEVRHADDERRAVPALHEPRSGAQDECLRVSQRPEGVPAHDRQ